MEREITWITSRGQAVVTVELITERDVNNDGDHCTVKCCEMRIYGEVKDAGLSGTSIEKLYKPIGANGTQYTHGCGKIAISKEKMVEINAAISEIKATPEWQAKLESERKAEVAGREYDEHCARMRKAMGGY